MARPQPPVETRFYLQCSEEEYLDLASGYVPKTVRAMVRFALDESEIDRRRAERPVKERKVKA